MPRIRLLLILFSLPGIIFASRSFGELPAALPLAYNYVDQHMEKPGRGKFLVSTRSLNDAHFGRSIVYLLEHGAQGTMGLIVNRSGNVSLFEAIPEITDQNAKLHRLYYGGPVGLPTLVMLANSKQPPEDMKHIEGDVYISSDRTVLDIALATGKNAKELRFFLGYSGWAPGQLDMEIAHGSWHVLEIDSSEIFSDDIDSLWDSLIEQLEPSGIQVRNAAFSIFPMI